MRAFTRAFRTRLLSSLLSKLRGGIGVSRPFLAAFLALVAVMPFGHSAHAQDLPTELQTDDPAEIERLLTKADNLTIIGHYFNERGDYQQAFETFRLALVIRHTLLGGEHQSIFVSSTDVALTYAKLGQFAKAEELLAETYRASQAIFGEQDPNTLTAMANFGVILSMQGRYEEAEEWIKEALRLKRMTLGETDPSTLSSLASYGSVLINMGRTAEAEPFFATALEGMRKMEGETSIEVLGVMSNYAVALSELGRIEEASALAKSNYALTAVKLGEDHPLTLLRLSNYASLLVDLNRSGEAETYLLKALSLSTDQLGEYHPTTLFALNNYASALSGLGRKQEAQQLFANLVRKRVEAFGENHPETIIAMQNNAALLSDLDRGEEAAAEYARALNLSVEVLGYAHPTTLLILSDVSAFLVSSESKPEFTSEISRILAIETRRRAKELVAQGLRASDQQARESGSSRDAEQLFVDSLWGLRQTFSGEAPHIEIEALNALQLATTGKASRAVAKAAVARFAATRGLQTLVDERAQLGEEWAQLDRAYASALSNGAQPGELRSRLAQIEARSEEIDKRLLQVSPEFLWILQPQYVDIEEIRTFIRDDEAILFLVPTDFGTHTMAITKTAISWNRSKLDSKAIERAVTELRDGLEIKNGEEFLPLFDLEQAHDLYAKLIQPVEGALEGKQRVYVVTDGALSRLPLGTLVTSQPTQETLTDDPDILRNTQWLADRYAMVQLPSLQSLIFVRKFGDKTAEQAAGFLGFGAPKLGAVSYRRSARSSGLDAIDSSALMIPRPELFSQTLMDPEALRKLAALPGTRLELEEVRRALGADEASLFLGERMTERSIRSTDLSETRILHLATHGFTAEESGTKAEPGLVFTPPQAASVMDDGYLAASEVIGLKLTMADWVILSACNTASPSSSATETGLSGLVEAFFYAGAKSLLVSHWPVFDEIAPVLVAKTLKLSQKGQPRAEALQAAMHDVRNDPKLDAAHPAVWAPFSLIGEGR